MEIKNSHKGFIPILIAIIIGGVIITSGAGFGFVQYKNVSDTITKAEQLLEAENYDEATNTFQTAQGNLLVSKLGIKRTAIEKGLEKTNTRKAHQALYQEGLNEIISRRLQEAITRFSDIPHESFYYHQAQTKIEEAKRVMVEGELAVEQLARQTAEQDARVEEVSRKQAEQREASERLAKEDQQRQTVVQAQRAADEEKDKYLEQARTNPLVRAIINGELKFYIDPLPSYAGTGVHSEVEDIADDFALWSPYTQTSIRRVYNPNDADITISWVRDFGGHTIGQAIFQSHVKVGLGTNNCTGQWRAFDAGTVKKILWHELGHSMGYGHSNNSNNIMYSQMATRFEIDQEISEVIAGGYYYTISFCDASSYSYSFEVSEIYGGFDLYVLPPDQDAYQISGGSGQYYPSCSKEGMRSYSGSCTVPSGAKIYIGNTSYQDAIRLSGKIIDEYIPPWPNTIWDENVFRYNNSELTKIWNLFN